MELRNIIKNKEDILFLVSAFYDKIKKDEMLAPIFNKVIPEDMWEEHIEKLTNFWNTALFGVVSYKGNPGMIHKKVDKQNNYIIKQDHFGQWLNLWFTTINESFYGDVAEKAKHAARKMSTGLFAVMWSQKPVT